MIGIIIRMLAVALVLTVSDAGAHDSATYGGLFRSRDLGRTWLNADAGLFLSAALSVAVDPLDRAHLLMGTDFGLMESRNGGQSWMPEAPSLIGGAVFSVIFEKDGRSAVCVTPTGVFRLQDGNWKRSETPDGAVPGRTLATGAGAGRLYLLGRSRLFRSEDGGRSFDSVTGAPHGRGPMTGVAVAAATAEQTAETLYAVIDGRIMASADGGDSWEARGTGLGPEPVDTLAPDLTVPGRIWAAQAGRIHVSDDAGSGWRSVGKPLPPETTVRGIAADPAGRSLTVSTHRGLYRSENGGDDWTPREGVLPFHLEAGPLFRVPHDPSTLYAVFSRTPYPDIWRAAVDAAETAPRSGSITLKGGLIFGLSLLAIVAVLLTRFTLTRRAARRSPSATLAGPLPPRVPSC
ncbi:photosystem II stability/assembly factor-like uncharacterized protein [Skermanella aerolata]|uniref:WD40/YVTN/BNR-like repeat-containing protein n=1 Tax=Skermanella aerolata TaxID=393310 RepID=UPI003D2211A9